MSRFKHKPRPRLKRRLYYEQGSRCCWCEVLIPLAELELATLDHWIPISHPQCGGSNSTANFRVMHKECNEIKDDLCPVCTWEVLFFWKNLRKMVSHDVPPVQPG